jgi:cyclopropane fatty-acyl-phospholipid synthase-like methyltransferase
MSERRDLDIIAGLVPRGSRVLDLGCGSGDLYLADLHARGFRTVGVDLSHRQAMRAHARCPQAIVVEGDAAQIELADGAFDGIVSYHAIFHMPRQEHAALFAHARRWVTDRGVALLTMAETTETDPVDGLYTDLLGAPTFYDAHLENVPLPLVESCGFDIVDCYRPDPRDRSGGVMMVLARVR